MDFVVSTCLWAQLPLLAEHRPFYDRRVAMYARLDGKDGRLDMRAELKAVLEEFFDSHPQIPHHAKTARRSKKRSAPSGETVMDLSQEDVDEFAPKLRARVPGHVALEQARGRRPTFCSFKFVDVDSIQTLG
jgi:hypothetical protein